ncbi:MAG: C10 family peptidase [Muribaculaceae bacterium]|nr:C10 family peptidase [Muribaculaceae bacterium]
MRKLLLLLFICLAVFANARQISSDEAAAIAADFLNSSASVQKAGLHVDVRRAQSKKNASHSIEENQPYYVFNAADNKGFVIISGDDEAFPILGFSLSGKIDFDNLPPQLKFWLDQYEAAFADVTNIKVSTIKTKAQLLQADGKLLATPLWGQDAPYNILLPKINDQHPVTGCTATAMAIIMKYHNFPENGNKSAVYWDWEKRENYTLDYENTYFDWANMLNEYTEDGYEQKNAEAVGLLMKCAGLSIGTYYGTNESGASIFNVSSVMQRFFRYSSDICEIARSKRGDTQWIEAIKQQIDNNSPVLYYGSGKGAHAFVIDGYQDNAFHINWGWDGNANGYFLLDELTPSIYDFTKDQGAIINIKPSVGEEVWSDCFMADERYFPFYHNPTFSVSVEKIVPCESFDVSTGAIAYPAKFNGHIGVVLTDKNRNIKEVVCDRNSMDNFLDEIVGARGSFMNCMVKSSTIEPGDSLYLATLDAGDKNWKLIKRRNEMPTSCACDDLRGDFATINWNVDPRLTLVLGDEQGNDIYEYKPDIHSLIKNRFLKGLYFSIRGEGASSSHGDFTAIKVNDEIINICGDTYPSLIWISLAEDQLDIEVLAHFKDEDISTTINCESAGSLHTYFDEKSAHHIVDLKLSGEINDNDMAFIRNNLPFIKKLDLKEAFVVASDTNDANAIPEYAFYGYSKLEELILPASIEKIGVGAFEGSIMKYLTLPSNLKYIGSNAFTSYISDIKAVYAPSNVPPLVDGSMFRGIENAILYVKPGCKDAFSNDVQWANFKKIVETENPIMKDVNINVKGITYTLNYDHFEITGYDEENCEPEITFESELTYEDRSYPVTEIGYKAMLYNSKLVHKCGLKKVIIPESVIKIGRGAFSCCYDLEEIIIKAHVTELPNDFCENCGKLKRIILPETLESMGQYCFSGGGYIDELYIPSNLKTIDVNSFDIANVVTISVSPDNKNFILYDGGLYSSDMTRLYLIPHCTQGQTISIPEGVKYMNWRLFLNIAKNSTINLPESLVELSYGGFDEYFNQLERFIIPDNVTGFSEGSIPLAEYLTIGKKIGFNHEDPSIIHGNTDRAFVRPYDVNTKTHSEVYLLNVSSLPLHKMLENRSDNKTNINFYSPYLIPNFTYTKMETGENHYFFVPGAIMNMVPETLKDMTFEMWDYRVNREEELLKIEPLIEGLVIDKVTVNGTEVAKGKGNIYYYGDDNNENIFALSDPLPLDVVVDYTLHGCQAMTTHYDAKFNVAIPSTNLTIVSEIVMSSEDVSLFIGKTAQLTVEVLPENAANKTLVWASSDENVATVDNDGMVTAVGLGDVIIIATATDGSGVSATCTVRVVPTLAESLTIDPKSWTGVEGETFQIMAEILPENTTDKTLNWSSSDETIATVNAAGLVSVLKEGSCRITAATTDGSNLAAECKLDVLSGIEEIFAYGATAVDVYNTQGVLIKKNCTKQELNQFSPGIYIIRGATEAIRIFIK